MAMKWGYKNIVGYFEFHPLVLSSLSPATVPFFFILTISTVSSMAIILLAYFVNEKNRLFALERVIYTVRGSYREHPRPIRNGNPYESK